MLKSCKWKCNQIHYLCYFFNPWLLPRDFIKNTNKTKKKKKFIQKHPLQTGLEQMCPAKCFLRLWSKPWKSNCKRSSCLTVLANSENVHFHWFVLGFLSTIAEQLFCGMPQFHFSKNYITCPFNFMEYLLGFFFLTEI